MGIRRKKKQSKFFEEDVIDGRFDQMMDLVKDLSRKDYNRLKDAMDLAYNAYQKVRNIDSATTITENNYMLNDKENE